MALMQELTNQGRVVSGHLANGTVLPELRIQHPLNPFKRHKISPETVIEWEDLATKDCVASIMGQAAAKAAVPGILGKAVGASLGAAMNSGHTVRVDWVDGKQSIIELPEKLFLVFSVQLTNQRVITQHSVQPETSMPAPAQLGVTDRIVDLASSVVLRTKPSTPTEVTAQPDVVEQITRLASLHDAGILTSEEFAAKKSDLLERL